VFAFLDAVARKLPSAVVMENVPGIESSRLGDGRLGDTIVCRLESLGYDVTACKLASHRLPGPSATSTTFLLAMREASVSPPDPRAFAVTRLGVDRIYPNATPLVSKALRPQRKPTRGDQGGTTGGPRWPPERRNAPDSGALRDSPVIGRYWARRRKNGVL
jgi:site-specific DNA-cytosine methylase